jgi:hypothetical protein
MSPGLSDDGFQAWFIFGHFWVTVGRAEAAGR